MSVQRIGRWTCPRCGIVVETGFENQNSYPDQPKGWRKLTSPTSSRPYDDDYVCASCWSEFKTWWADREGLA